MSVRVHRAHGVHCRTTASAGRGRTFTSVYVAALGARSLRPPRRGGRRCRGGEGLGGAGIVVRYVVGTACGVRGGWRRARAAAAALPLARRWHVQQQATLVIDRCMHGCERVDVRDVHQRRRHAHVVRPYL